MLKIVTDKTNVLDSKQIQILNSRINQFSSKNLYYCTHNIDKIFKI